MGKFIKSFDHQRNTFPKLNFAKIFPTIKSSTVLTFWRLRELLKEALDFISGTVEWSCVGKQRWSLAFNYSWFRSSKSVTDLSVYYSARSRVAPGTRSALLSASPPVTCNATMTSDLRRVKLVIERLATTTMVSKLLRKANVSFIQIGKPTHDSFSFTSVYTKMLTW